MFPYLWLWNLVTNSIGRFITPEKFQEMITKTMPPELLERHEMDPFRADTFDGAFLSFHLNRFALNLGPEVGKDDFNMAVAAPHDKYLKEQVFIRLVDQLARKTIYFSGRTFEGQPPRFYLKGHFLYAAETLSEFYPDANFLTVIRDPLSRLQSGINYMRVNPADPVLGPVPWSWLAETLTYTEVNYSQLEQVWFTQEDDVNRCVIKFTDFVNDLENVMGRIYSECFGIDELPEHVSKVHAPRERKNYSVNRSLIELDIDENEIKRKLRDYINWCQS
jgi:hypothetical protein